jgi:hypothetical protein
VNVDARGVQLLRLVEQAKPGHRDCDRRIFERACELSDRAGCNHRVRVQEDEDVSGRLAGAEIRSRREAEVLAGVEDLHS